MNGAEHDYDTVCRAANPAACVRRLNDAELRALCAHAEGLIRQNGASGGIPEQIKFCCVIEAARRFLQPPTTHP